MSFELEASCWMFVETMLVVPPYKLDTNQHRNTKTKASLRLNTYHLDGVELCEIGNGFSNGVVMFGQWLGVEFLEFV